jgi:hypothetical protein
MDVNVVYDEEVPGTEQVQQVGNVAVEQRRPHDEQPGIVPSSRRMAGDEVVRKVEFVRCESRPELIVQTVAHVHPSLPGVDPLGSPPAGRRSAPQGATDPDLRLLGRLGRQMLDEDVLRRLDGQADLTVPCLLDIYDDVIPNL